MAGEKSLKARNAAWLWSIAVFDCAILLAVQLTYEPTATESITELLRQSGLRIAATSAAPVLVLLLTSILPASVKNSLVFWRARDALPSHRAFTVHTHADPRIDLQRLRTNVGQFPDAPRDQSSFWYRLYKRAEAETAVAITHRHYLLFRDLAAMSFLLAFVVPVVFRAYADNLWLPAVVLFTIQYGLSALAARHCGTRLVTTVLALHSAKKYPAK